MPVVALRTGRAMTVLDVIVLLVVAGAALAGLFRGAVRVAFGILGLAGGLWLAVRAGAAAAEWLAGGGAPGLLEEVVARLGLFAGAVFLATMAGWGLDRALRAVGLGWLNRIGGAVLTGGVAAALLAVLLIAAASVSPTARSAVSSSALAGPLVGFVEELGGE